MIFFYFYKSFEVEINKEIIRQFARLYPRTAKVTGHDSETQELRGL